VKKMNKKISFKIKRSKNRSKKIFFDYKINKLSYKDLSVKYKLPQSTIMEIIGRVLMNLCRKDSSCPYKPLLPEYDVEIISIQERINEIGEKEIERFSI